MYNMLKVQPIKIKIAAYSAKFSRGVNFADFAKSIPKISFNKIVSNAEIQKLQRAKLRVICQIYNPGNIRKVYDTC